MFWRNKLSCGHRSVLHGMMMKFFVLFFFFQGEGEEIINILDLFALEFLVAYSSGSCCPAFSFTSRMHDIAERDFALHREIEHS